MLYPVKFHGKDILVYQLSSHHVPSGTAHLLVLSSGLPMYGNYATLCLNTKSYKVKMRETDLSFVIVCSNADLRKKK